MIVTINNIDSANAILSVKIEKTDYQEKVEKSLRNFRQKANIPGFRKGMTPMGMIKKMYEKSVVAEEINKLVSEGLYGYIQENKVNILGEPLPNVSLQKPVDFEKDEAFEFLFDLGMAPTIKIALSKKDKADYYNVEVSEDMIQKQSKAFTDRAGQYIQAETIEGKDMIKGSLVELDEAGAAKEEGISAPDSAMIPSYFKNEIETAKFIGAAKGDTIIFNPFDACNGNEFEMAHILKVDKAEAKDVKSNFSYTITEITRHITAELSQEVFDSAFGEGTISTEAEYFAKIKESLQAQMKPESDYKFWLDIRPLLEAKVGEIAFPIDFLKRWLVASGENRTVESVEEELPAMIKELTWHLIKENLAKDNEVKVEQADLMEIAKATTRAQFASYGMMEVPSDTLEKYSADMLKDEKSRRNLIERAVEDKVRDAVKAQISLNEKAISQEDFYKLFEA